MSNNKLLTIAKEFQQKYTSFKQISFYICINLDLLQQVSELFPEFDSDSETPFFFYSDRKPGGKGPKWIMLSESKLYYSLVYYPDGIDVLNCIPLHKIDSFKIGYKRWIVDMFVEINGKKVGSIKAENKEEIEILAQFVNIVLKNYSESIVPINEEPLDLPGGNLENAILFKIAKDYFDDVNVGGKLWGFEYFYYGHFIPDDKLKEAQQEYAGYNIDEEAPIIYYDSAYILKHFNEPSGFVITNKYLYYKLKTSLKNKEDSRGKIPLSQIIKFNIKTGFCGWIIINEGRLILMVKHFTWFGKKEAKIFEELIQRFIQALN